MGLFGSGDYRDIGPAWTTFSCPRCGASHFKTQTEADKHCLKPWNSKTCSHCRGTGLVYGSRCPTCQRTGRTPFWLNVSFLQLLAILRPSAHLRVRHFKVYKLAHSCYNTPIMAKKNNTKRKLVGLVSEESGIRAYYTKKNTMNTPDKLSLRKYDPVLRKHVVFTETKKNLGRNEVKEKKR